MVNWPDSKSDGLPGYAQQLTNPSLRERERDDHVSYSLNSFEGGRIGDYYTGAIKWDTRSLDYNPKP